MNQKRYLSVIVIAVLVLSMASISMVHASIWASSCTLTVSGSSHGPQQVQFNPTDTVYIYWTANGKVNISVTNTDTDTPVVAWLNQASTGQKTIPNIAAGHYLVQCTGSKTYDIAVGTFFALPEYVLGALAALTACFAGIAVFAVYKKRTTNLPLKCL